MIRGSGVEGVSKGSIEAANSRMRTASDVHPNPSLVSNVLPTQEAVARIVASAKPLTLIPSPPSAARLRFYTKQHFPTVPSFPVAHPKRIPFYVQGTCHCAPCDRCPRIGVPPRSYGYSVPDPGAQRQGTGISERVTSKAEVNRPVGTIHRTSAIHMAIHNNVVYDVLPMTSGAVRALPCR